MLGEGVEQDLLQLFPGHPVVEVGYLDVCTVGERLRLGVRTWATRGDTQRGRTVRQAWRATSKERREV